MDINIQYEIEFTKECRNEIRKSYNYIRDNFENIVAARRLMIKIERIVNNLKFVPKMYMELAKYSGTKRIYRRIVINNYILIYTVDDLNHKVYISHFYYGGSDYINRI